MADKRELEPRQAPRLLEPGPLVLVSSLYRAQPNLMTAAWLLPLGFGPARVAVAIHPARLTHEFISRSESFALNIPTLDLLSAVHRCGMESGRDADKFATSGLTPADAQEIEAPLVEECVAHIECGLVERLSLADHDLFVGEVLAVSVLEDAFSDRWRLDAEVNLLHHIAGAEYAGLSRAYQARLDEDEEE